MKLSFVIPAYNEEKYIGLCLESVLADVKNLKNEPGREVEIIVVNNASTDRTKEVASSYPSVIVVDEAKKGLTRARQAGYLASTGDLIANIDADTVLPFGWTEKVFEKFSKNEKLVALSGPYIFYDLSKMANYFVLMFYFIGSFINIFYKFFRIGSMLQGGNYIVKKSALDKIGGFNTEIDFYGEDTDIARRIHKEGKVVFTFKLPMYTTARRLKGEGFFTMFLRYGINYLWTTFFKKPFTKESIDIRT